MKKIEVVELSKLGDTRLGKEDEELFLKMWGGKVFFNSLCGNKRGIAVLVKTTPPFQT